MLHSKASAVLQRLKEMDRKYNVKWNEGKRVQSVVSTESSLEESPRKLRTFDVKDGPVPIGAAERERTKLSPKGRMEVKIPINKGKGDESSISDIVTLKESPKMKPLPENSKDIKSEEEKETSEESSKTVSIMETGFKTKRQDSQESSANTVLSEKSNTSEVIKSVDELFTGRSDGKSNVPEVTEADSTLNTDNNGTMIEETIATVTEKSESISEVSNERDVLTLKEEQKNRYDDDTFEEVSSSSESVNSAIERLKKPSEEDTVISGIKQIKITPHKQAESQPKIAVNEDKWLTHENPKDKEIVELIPPKVVQSTSECDIGLDEELSNYVKKTENVDDTVPIALLKLSKQMPSAKRHARKGKRHRKSSNENIEAKTESPVLSEHEKLTERKEAAADVAEKDESSIEKKNEEASSPKLEEDKNRSDEKVAESRAETENHEPRTISSEEKFLREIPIKSDVTSTLRKLNKDAINAIVRRQKVHGSGNRHKHCKNCGTVVTLPTADKSRNEVDDSDSSVENIRTFKDSCHDQRIRDKQRGKCRKTVRASKKKSSHYSKVESKHSRFDCRQTHRLRKHAVAIRLQQEREDIRNYLLELERTRLEYGPGESVTTNPITAFRRLEFPKIAAFLRPDPEDASLKQRDEMNELRERILMIRQWLKDQYILYRDYSNLAQTINSKYIPASLEDAKRTIRQLQRATVETR